MAHLWLLNDSHEWTCWPLLVETFALGDGRPRLVEDAHAEVNAAAPALLRRLADPPNTWAVAASSPALRLNGAPVPLGLAVLEDRDELRWPTGTAWFSTETQAHVEPFSESTARGFCPRCRQAIAVATPSVRCPGCGLWHHASEDLPCWTYSPTCAACAQDTALDAWFRWTPEDL